MSRVNLKFHKYIMINFGAEAVVYSGSSNRNNQTYLVGRNEENGEAKTTRRDAKHQIAFSVGRNVGSAG